MQKLCSSPNKGANGGKKPTLAGLEPASNHSYMLSIIAWHTNSTFPHHTGGSVKLRLI